MPYLVRREQAFYTCPVNSCQAQFANLKLVIQHLIGQHITVQDEVTLVSKGEASEEAHDAAKEASEDCLRQKKQSKGWNCDVCCRTYASKYNLSRHFKTAHGNAQAEQSSSIADENLDGEATPSDDIFNEDHEDAIEQGEAAHEDSSAITDKEVEILEPDVEFILQGSQKSTSEVFQCESCPKGFAYKHNLKRHVQSKHSQRSNPQEDQEEAQILDQDYVDESEKPLFQCEVCSKCFKVKHNLKRHLKAVHKDEFGPDPNPQHVEESSRIIPNEGCHQIQDGVKEENVLEQDQEQAVSKEDWQCELCSKSFSNKHNLKRHKKTLHGTDQNPREALPACEWCSKVFSKRSNLNRHVRAAHHKE